MSQIEHDTLALCSYCPRLCRHSCPTALGDSKETYIPTHKIGFVQMWQEGLVPFNEELVEIFYACTDCGACTATCKHGATPAEILYKSKKEAIRRNVIPQGVSALLERSLREGHLFGDASEERLALEYDPNAPVQLLAGESMGWRAREIRMFVEALKLVLGKEVSVLPYHVTSGATAHSIGDIHMLDKHAEQLVEHISAAKLLVVADPYCEKTIKKSLPAEKIYLGCEVQNLLEIFENADVAPLDAWYFGDAKAFFHDPNYYARFGGDAELPRRLLRKLGFDVLEFARSRQQAWASGAEGLYRWLSPSGARRNASFILREIYAYGRRHDRPTPPVVTVGENERSLFAQSEPGLAALDLNVLVASAILEHAGLYDAFNSPTG